MAVQSYPKKQAISDKQPNLHLKQLESTTKKPPKVSGRKEIIKIRSEIKEIETKKTIEMISESKS